MFERATPIINAQLMLIATLGRALIKPEQRQRYALDNVIDQQRRRQLGEIATKHQELQLHDDGTLTDEQRAAEQASLPEVEAVMMFCQAQGPRTHNEIAALDPAAPPEPKCERDMMFYLMHAQHRHAQ